MADEIDYFAYAEENAFGTFYLLLNETKTFIQLYLENKGNNRNVLLKNFTYKFQQAIEWLRTGCVENPNDWVGYTKRVYQWAYNAIQSGKVDKQEYILLHKILDELYIKKAIFSSDLKKANELAKEVKTQTNLTSTKQNIMKTEKLSAKAKAIAVWTEHPDWTDTKIAQKAGISRTTLYDYPEFKKLRAMQKQNKRKFLRGNKAKDGTIEAIDE